MNKRNILAAINNFLEQTEEDEYVDSGEAIELLHYIKETLEDDDGQEDGDYYRD
jgi:hypothetical protein